MKKLSIFCLPQALIALLLATTSVLAEPPAAAPVAEAPPADAPADVHAPVAEKPASEEAPIADQPTAVPASTEAAAPVDAKAAPSAAADAAPEVNAGLEDLDKAAQLKVTAENLPDLNEVVDKLDLAVEKGLDKDNQAFADQLLVSALLQRATVLSAAVLEQPVADPRRDPRWMQIRQFAVNDLLRVVSVDKNIWEAHLLLGRLQALPMGDPKAAKRELTLVIDAEEASPEDRAQSYALRGALQTEEAKRIADFDKAIELAADKPDYYRVRAQYRYSQEKFTDALADIDKALELKADHAASQELRGMILLGLKQYDEALKSFSKASELAPKAVLPLQHLGEVYRQQGDLKKAAEQLGKALELQPNDPATLLLRANILYQLEDTAGALKDVDAAIKANPQLLVAHLLQAEILASDNKIDEAIVNLEKLRPLAQDNPRLLEPLATFYLVGGYPRKAIDTFSKIIELEPTNYRALRFRGDAHLNIGNHAEAVADFDAALKLNADDDGLLNNLAWVLATSPDDAVRDGKRAIELATKAAAATSYNTPHILSTLAAAYAESGDFENAKKWSQKAVETCEQELAGAKTDAARKQAESNLVALKKELASYEAKQPTRERQEQADKQPAAPADTDRTIAPPSAEPAPARTADF